MSSFPQNIIDELTISIREHMGDEHDVVQRPVRATDSAMTVGLFLTESAPRADSVQIGQTEPAIKTYSLRIQLLVQSTDEEDGRAQFALSGKILEAVLYRDTVMHVRLRELTEDLLGTRERVHRFGVSRTRYLNNELNSTWLYVAGTDFWVETELTKL